MIRAGIFKGIRVAVFGLGGSGRVAVEALLSGGAEVIAWDDGEGARARAKDAGIPLADLREIDWSSINSLLLAPGVPLTHPEPHWSVQLATAAGVEIIGDMEVFQRIRSTVAPHAPVVAITGTNGKSTTTALLAHVLEALGCNVEIGGNIGKAVLSLAPPANDRVHVLEVSSYQIDLAPTFSPTVSVLLNITPDHIDRHGTFENYAHVKARMLIGSELAVICIDDAMTRAIGDAYEPAERFYPVTAGKGAAIVPKIYAIGSSVFAHELKDGHAVSAEIADLSDITSLRGQHNVQNVVATFGVLRALQDFKDVLRQNPALGTQWSIPDVWRPNDFQDALSSFPGLPHRLEEVGRSNKTVFINDSKATNAEAASKALAAFEGDIYWIAGGLAKDGGIESLAPYFPRIAKAYLIGEAAPTFAETLTGHVAYEVCKDLETAVRSAATDADEASNASAGNVNESVSASGRDDCVVLFSPACASFDQFKNFEVRGEAFREAVSAISGVVMKIGAP